jgi:hypothetical protein
MSEAPRTVPRMSSGDSPEECPRTYVYKENVLSMGMYLYSNSLSSFRFYNMYVRYIGYIRIGLSKYRASGDDGPEATCPEMTSVRVPGACLGVLSSAETLRSPRGLLFVERMLCPHDVSLIQFTIIISLHPDIPTCATTPTAVPYSSAVSALE